MNTLLSELERYFETHSAQDIKAAWDAVAEFENVGVTFSQWWRQNQLDKKDFQQQYQFVIPCTDGAYKHVCTDQISSKFPSSLFILNKWYDARKCSGYAACRVLYRCV